MDKQSSKGGVAARLSNAAREAVRRMMGAQKPAAPEKAEMAKDAPKQEEKPH